MSTQKINMSNPVLRTRVKKYDTYQNRNGGAARQNMTGINPVTVASGPLTASSQKSVAQVNLVPTQPQYNKTPSHQPLHQNKSKHHVVNNSLRDSQQKGSMRAHTTYISTQPHQAPSTRKVALQAVAAAQLYDNETYPDNETTLYGSAKRKITLVQKLMYGLGVTVLLFSAFVSIQSFMTNKEAKEQIATLGQNATKDDQGVTEGTGNDPSEEEVPEAAVAAYQVKNPNDPRYIRIPELGILARVKNLGIDKNGAVDSPWNIYDAGWYNGSARPGSTVGSSLILGHVSGWTGPGVFKNIDRLVPGAQFEIEKGNGEKVTYSVTKTEKIPLDQVNMAKILGSEVAGQHDMKLMTCSGRYNKETKTYEDRFVVYAKVVK